MRFLIQRVKRASVKNLETNQVHKIEKGLLIFIGIKKGDDFSKFDWTINKILNLRIFPDENNRFQYSVLDIKGEILIVSQFTLYADIKKGRRPDFIKTENPERAKILYSQFVMELKNKYSNIKEGWFGKMMDVEILNWGPVTILIDV